MTAATPRPGAKPVAPQSAATTEAAARTWTDVEALDLWWRVTRDGWAVPDDLPGRFLRAAGMLTGGPGQ